MQIERMGISAFTNNILSPFQKEQLKWIKLVIFQTLRQIEDG